LGICISGGNLFRVLVVDDEPGIRAALEAILHQCGHKVVKAENGRRAQEILSLESFDLVITDLQMPEVDGLVLIQWIKTNKPTPIFLLTAFTQILETQQAYQLGVSEFFSKPFSFKAITDAISKLRGEASGPAEPEDVDALYCRIPIEDFVSSTGIQISVYIKLAEKKYVRVAHKGDEIPVERVENYKAKGLSFLYAKKEDFSRLVGFNLNLSELISKTSKISAEKKMAFLRYTTELILENTVVNGVHSKSFHQAVDCLNTCLTVIAESDNILTLLEVLDGHSDWLYAHSLGVSIYSVMIGRKMGFSSQSTLFKLTMSGLFHDIGQKELEKSILAKGRGFLSLDERKRMESHAARSREILRELREISEDIVQIVYEHHEDCTGRGYPRQVPAEKIHPLAKIVATADRFCYLALKNPHSSGCHAGEALRQMAIHHTGEIDRSAFTALKAVCDLNGISA
jgi:putative nucleotidyltransferase with HDIG domain